MPTYCALSFSHFDSSEMHIASIYVDHKTPEYLRSKERTEVHEYFEEYSSFLEINCSEYHSSKISCTKIDKRIDSLLDICKTLKNFFILISEKDYEMGFGSSGILFSKEQLLFIKESSEYRNLIDCLKSRMHITKFINSTNTEYKLKNALVVYLELNGASLKIISDSEKMEENNDRMVLGQGISRDFMLFDGENSLFNTINRTSTKNGQAKLRSEIGSPFKNKTLISRRRDFLRSFQNAAFIPELQKMLRSIRPYQPMRTEVEIKLDPSSSLILGKSQNEKSIYSRRSLDETSIGRYKSLVRRTADLFTNISIFDKISNYFKHQFKDKSLPSEINDLLVLLNSAEINEIKSILNEFINQNFNCKGFLDDELSLVIRSKLDGYLDLSRSIYFKRLKECQQLILKIIENSEMEIHRTEQHEICIKQDRKALKTQKTNENCESGKTQTPLRDVSNRSKHAAKKNRKRSAFDLTENKTEAKFSSERKHCKFNGATKKLCDKIKANKNTIYKIKTTKNYALYTNNKIKTLNEVISDSLNQIIEIQGKICKSILLRLEKYDNVLNQAFDEIGELDICVGMIISINDWHKKQARDGLKKWAMNTNDNNRFLEDFTIRNALNLLIKDSIKTQYSFDRSNVKLITGPNMCGKTAYLRNLAHLIILSQIGYLVPCEYMKIPIFDELYYISTRDDIVELDCNLRARPCLNESEYRTPRVLVLIDEVQCSTKIQMALIRILERAKILSLFVSHNLKMIEYCKREKYEIYTFEDFRMREGTSKLKNSFEICQNILPAEIIEKMKKTVSENSKIPSDII